MVLFSLVRRCVRQCEAVYPDRKASPCQLQSGKGTKGEATTFNHYSKYVTLYDVVSCSRLSIAKLNRLYRARKEKYFGENVFIYLGTSKILRLSLNCFNRLFIRCAVKMLLHSFKCTNEPDFKVNFYILQPAKVWTCLLDKRDYKLVCKSTPLETITVYLSRRVKEFWSRSNLWPLTLLCTFTAQYSR